MRPAIPRFHLISDRTLMPLGQMAELLPVLIGAGVDAVHLREKDLLGGDLARAARTLRAAITEDAAFILNERVDVALLTQADGVQLGEKGLCPGDVRLLGGQHFLVGRSVHNIEGARQAEADGADYLLAGNIFPTWSKAGLPGRGLELIAELSAATALPVIAIGGIRPEHVPPLLGAGAYGIAVISGILAAIDPLEAAIQYMDQLIRSVARDDRSQGQRKADVT